METSEKENKLVRLSYEIFLEGANLLNLDSKILEDDYEWMCLQEKAFGYFLIAKRLKESGNFNFGEEKFNGLSRHFKYRIYDDEKLDGNLTSQLWDVLRRVSDSLDFYDSESLVVSQGLARICGFYEELNI